MSRHSIISLLMMVLVLSGCGRSGGLATFSNYGQDKRDGPVITVRQNDNLYKIAKRNQVSTRALIGVNHLTPPYHLRPGQRLKLPKPSRYTVKKGDTLFSLSRTFNVSIREVVKLNNLSAPHQLAVGQELVLPAGYTATTKVRVAKTTKYARKKKKKRRRRNTFLKPPPKRAGSRFLRPVNGRIISSFGSKKGGLHNDGINILSPKGTAVKVADNGVVAYTGNELRGFGNLVLVRHDGGWVTAYAHLDKITVKKGQTLSKGLKLGTVGKTGSVRTPQLHFEVRRKSRAVNPMKYLAGGR